MADGEGAALEGRAAEDVADGQMLLSVDAGGDEGDAGQVWQGDGGGVEGGGGEGGDECGGGFEGMALARSGVVMHRGTEAQSRGGTGSKRNCFHSNRKRVIIFTFTYIL